MPSIPSLQSFEEFEKKLCNRLHLINESRITGGIYSDEVIRAITESESALSFGDVGEWLKKTRIRPLNEAYAELCKRQEEHCNKSGSDNKYVQAEISQAKKLESKIRFFGEFAILSGKHLHKKNNIHVTATRDALANFSKSSDSLKASWDRLSRDDYFNRRISSQERAAMTQVATMLNAVEETLSVISKLQLHPYLRVKPETIARQVIACDIADLCIFCFGKCPPRVLEKLLNAIEVDLPDRLDDWLKKQINVAQKMQESYDQTRLLVDVRLPILLDPAPLRPDSTRRPWLEA